MASGTSICCRCSSSYALTVLCQQLYVDGRALDIGRPADRREPPKAEWPEAARTGQPAPQGHRIFSNRCRAVATLGPRILDALSQVDRFQSGPDIGRVSPPTHTSKS